MVMELIPHSGKKLTCKVVLKKREYAEMVKLAKEMGMTNMRQYVKYCMMAILESHKGEIKLESFQEASS